MNQNHEPGTLNPEPHVPTMRLRRALLLVALVAAVAIGYGLFRLRISPASPEPAGASAGSSKITIPFSEAQPIAAAMRGELPGDLAGKSDGDIAAAWPGWTASRDADIRARLARG